MHVCKPQRTYQPHTLPLIVSLVAHLCVQNGNVYLVGIRLMNSVRNAAVTTSMIRVGAQRFMETRLALRDSLVLMIHPTVGRVSPQWC
jgi:hypothetical protein